MKDRIKELRKSLKMTQPQFAEKLHLASNYISLVESGKNPVSDKMVFNICNIFGVSEEWLRTGEGEMMKPLDREAEIAKITNQMLDEVEPSIRNALHRIISEMTEDQLETLLECARKLVDTMDNENASPE